MTETRVGSPSFMAEIRKIMYVCGDCVQPSVESAAMVEDITQQQVVQLAVKAMEYARLRCDGTGSGVAITVEDILFLLRKDKGKLKRVLYQIDFKALARTSSIRDDGTENDNPPESGVGGGGGGGGRRPSLEADFLTDMFGSDFYNAEEVVQLRQEWLERHDSRTRGMDSAEYMTYVQCRQTSFIKNNMARFRKWLNLESVIGHTPAQDVMEVLGYLAYDTVRELVELSLLVKEDIARGHQEIISSRHFVLPSSHPPTILPSPPPHTTPPPQLPHKSPNQPISSSGGSQVPSSEALVSTRNPRGRKRKRSVADTAATVRRDSTSEQPQGSGHAPEPSRNEMGTDKSGRGIQPLHIREAMRRLSIPSGPLLPLATHHCRPSFTQKTVCL